MDTDATTPRRTAVAMVVVGLGYAVFYPLMMGTGQDGWVWSNPNRNFAFEHMLYAMYVTLGVFLIWGARRPGRYVSLINYTIVSNVLHAATMLYNSLADSGEHEHLHLTGDVVGTFAGALILLACHPGLGLERLAGQTKDSRPA